MRISQRSPPGAAAHGRDRQTRAGERIADPRRPELGRRGLGEVDLQIAQARARELHAQPALLEVLAQAARSAPKRSTSSAHSSAGQPASSSVRDRDPPALFVQTDGHVDRPAILRAVLRAKPKPPSGRAASAPRPARAAGNRTPRAAGARRRRRRPARPACPRADIQLDERVGEVVQLLRRQRRRRLGDQARARQHGTRGDAELARQRQRQRGAAAAATGQREAGRIGELVGRLDVLRHPVDQRRGERAPVPLHAAGDVAGLLAQSGDNRSAS